MTGRITDHATARRAALIATIWIPLAIVAVAEVVVVGFGPRGDHHRIGPWWTYPVLIAAITIPVIAITGFFIARAKRMAGMNGWMSAIAVGLAVFHAVGLGVGPAVLRGTALNPVWPLAGGLVLAVVAALLTWRLLPREAPATTSIEPADVLPVRPGEVAAWTGRLDLPAWLASLIAAIAATILVLGVSVLLISGRHLWVLFILPAFLLAVLLVTAQFVVTAGPSGLIVHSAVGWPRLRIRSTDLAKAAVVTIDPMSDFGGWGVRWVIGPTHHGRWGIITRRGPGLEVFRRDGRSIVITVDDATTAAAVLETYATKQI